MFTNNSIRFEIALDKLSSGSVEAAKAVLTAVSANRYQAIADCVYGDAVYVREQDYFLDGGNHSSAAATAAKKAGFAAKLLREIGAANGFVEVEDVFNFGMLIRNSYPNQLRRARALLAEK